MYLILEFLGLIFDKRLSWSKQVKYVVNKSKSKINLLRTLTGYAWGANKKTLLRLHRILIRSRLEYGIEVIHTASKAVLNKLNVIHSRCLGIITGAIKSIPVMETSAAATSGCTKDSSDSR